MSLLEFDQSRLLA